MTEELDNQDDLSQGYGVTARIREELNSPALQALKMAGGLSEEPAAGETPPAGPGEKQRTPGNQKYYDLQIKLGRKPEEIEKDLEGMKEPSIDPVSAFFGGAGAPLKIGLSQAARLTPTLIRALGSGTAGAAMEYPIGMATEKVEEAYPKLAVPFSVLAGMVSGATIETQIEKGIMKAAAKIGGGKFTPEVIKNLKTEIMAKLQDEAGGLDLAKKYGALLKTMTSLQPPGQNRALVSITELRAAAKMSDNEFDEALLELAREGKVALHEHDFASSLKEEARKKLLSVENPQARWGGRTYYVGVVPRAEVDPTIYRSVVDTLNEEAGKLKSKLKDERGSFSIEPRNPVVEDLAPAKPAFAETSTFRHVLGDPSKPLVEVSKEKVDSLVQKAGTFLDQDVTDLPEKAININFGRIESGDDIKEVLARTAEVFKDEIQAARRGVQSNEQTAKLAGLIGLSPEQLLARRRGAAFNAEEALAARRILVSSGDRLATLSKIISGRIPVAETEFADATLPELQAAFQKQILVHAGIQEQVSGMTAEAGRALQSFRIMAKSTEGKLKAVDELMKNINKSKMSTEDLAAMIAGIDTGEGLNTFVRQVRKATKWDMVMEAWINGLLSGPVTHTANMMSNGLVALFQVPERAIAAGISRLTGDQEIKLAEAGYQAFGMVEGFKNGLKAFGKAVRTGEASDQFAKIDLPMRRAISAKNFGMDDPGVAARAVDLLGEGVRIPGRLLTAEDEFFKSVGYRMELNARAYRQASQEGLSGDALTKRVKEIVADPPDDISSSAIDAARYQTFTRDLGEVGSIGQRFLAKAPALRLIVPFVQTPVNILKYAGERTPLALASKSIREEIAAGGARRDIALARISMGSMIMATAAGAAGAGMITGGGPSDPELKAALRRTGWQPYSIKLGDTYYAYNRLEPLGMLLGIAADASEIISQADDNDAGEIASAAVIAISKNVTSKTWLKGVADAVEALDDPDRSAKKFLMNYVRSVVPTGLAQIEKETDPVVRETWDRSFFGEVANNIKARIPGWSDSLPPKRNLWGEAITWEGAAGPDIVSPVYISTAKRSPIDDEMARLKMEVAMPAKIQSFEREEIPLSPKEYDRYVQIVNTTPLPSTGMTLKKSLNDLVTKDPEYRDAPDERREVMIKRMILQARDVARPQLLEEMPGLRMELDQIHHERSVRESGGAARRRPSGGLPTM